MGGPKSGAELLSRVKWTEVSIMALETRTQTSDRKERAPDLEIHLHTNIPGSVL